jgi:predicted nucleic acid-binding Zn ribbon protein
MATYVYETIPQKAGAKSKRFEVQQSMKDSALTKHPETGEPVRRVIVGGLGFIGSEKSAAPKPAHSCGSGCGCSHN